MGRELSQMQPTLPRAQVDKVILGSLFPMEYAGESDFEDYYHSLRPWLEHSIGVKIRRVQLSKAD